MEKYEYFLIILYLIIAILLPIIMLSISFLLNKKTKYNESKLSTYESGCLPTSDNNTGFIIHFYVIGIIFLILDIEIILLFPWLLNIKNLNIIGFYKIFYILFILCLGFAYEWLNNALNWIKNDDT